MRIRLVNFRCYEDSTFDFGDQGIALLSGPSGKGKCLGKDMEILMYDCTIKKVQDIEVGDILMGDDSSPRTVLSTCSGRDNMYKIIPKKGEPYTVNSQHILTLKTDKSRIRYRNDRKIWSVRYYHNGHQQNKDFNSKIEAETFQCKLSDEPYDISVEEYLKLPLSSRKFNYTYHTGINLPEQYLEFDPYWLGLWLGNGTSCQPEITTIDQEILHYLYCFCENNRFTLKKSHDISYRINDKDKGNKNRLTVFLKKYNLINNKHIPLIYKKSSRAQRLSLLAGLIDSDGHVDYNTVNIIQKSKVLAADIKFLALSLGYMAVLSTRQKLCTNSETPIHTNYNICIYGEGLEDIPTILPRKKLVSRKQSKRATIHSFDVVTMEEDQYFGFELDGNGRFLLSDCKVTHNSSILMGIYFALFGSGTKVTAYGKTSCFVELEFDGMKVKRTKKPNRLVVNDVYEDDSAQEIINKKFGDTFDVTGYIAQNALNSFILMSPIDKLTFLEKFAFRDVDLGKIKGRCKAYISKQNDELVSVASQLEMAKNVLDELIPPDEVKFPLNCKTNQREQAIKNENIRYKNCNTLIRRAEKVKQAAQVEVNDLRVLEATLKSRQEQYDEATQKLKDVKVELENISYDGDDSLRRLEKKLEKYLTRRELRILEDKLEDNENKLRDMKLQETKSIQSELTEIETVLWKEYSQQELKNTLSDLHKCVEDMESVERLRKEVKRCTVDMEKHEKHKKDLKEYTESLHQKQKALDRLIARKELYSCPACMAKLRLHNNNLILSEEVEDKCTDSDIDTVKQEIDSIRYNMSKLHRLIPTEEDKIQSKHEAEKEIDEILSSYEEIPEIVEVKEDIEYLRQYQASQNELEKKKRELEKNIKTENFSSSYNTFKQSIEKLRTEVQNLQNDVGKNTEKINEEELRTKITQQKQAKNNTEKLSSMIEKLEGDIERCKSILDKTKNTHIEIYGDIRDEDELEDRIAEQDIIISEQEIKRNEHEKTLKQIDEWKVYQEQLDNYNNWEVKVENLEKDEKEARNRYAAATQLKDKFLEAESIAMLNIIESINTHARVYLDVFFTDSPISVQLQPFKETKKSTKPCINITIEYKGMEADMNMLSGGELSRVILAYTLALAEMFNSPLLLLDECTASLDQDLTSTVFESIKDNFSGKMTLIIAHQIVEGTFDKVVCLGKTD